MGGARRHRVDCSGPRAAGAACVQDCVRSNERSLAATPSMKSWFRSFFTAEQKSVPVAQREAAAHHPPNRFADDNNAFALRLYGHRGKQTGNLFFSPFSVRSAFATTYAGARGGTAAEIGDALHFPAAHDELYAALGGIVRRLGQVSRGEYEMAGANSLWVQHGAPLESAFVALVASLPGDCLKSADFRHAAETARVNINAWVEEGTKGRIRDLIPAGAMSPAAVLVIVNAVYFKARWLHPFHGRFTRNECFYLDDGSEVRAPLMQCHNNFGYAQTNDFQAVDLPYSRGELSMLVLLPTTRDGLRHVEETLSIQILNH